MMSDGPALTDAGSMPVALPRDAAERAGSWRPEDEREMPVEEIVSLVDPASFAADQYRSLRHNVERLRRDAGSRVFAVTSPGPGDGKTVTTLNLAGALAQCRELKVLVIDADLRRPAVATYLGLKDDESPGLADLLDADYAIEQVTRRLERFNLCVVPAGSPRAAAYELLNSARLESTIAEATRRYDYVLVDTPPLVPLPDCRLVAKCVDGFLLVVAAHRTPRKTVARALDMLEPAKTIGIVFNGDSAPGSRRDSYYASYYTPRTRDARRRRWWHRR
jgi:capsular exopolysaccharide synthesis family protein